MNVSMNCWVDLIRSGKEDFTAAVASGKFSKQPFTDDMKALIPPILNSSCFSDSQSALCVSIITFDMDFVMISPLFEDSL